SVARRLNVTIPTSANTYYDYLRERWARDVIPGSGIGGSFDDAWREVLQTGFVQSITPAAAAALATQAASLAQTLGQGQASFAGEAGDDAFHLVVYPSYRFYDGRLANRPWLQELPDPIS